VQQDPSLSSIALPRGRQPALILFSCILINLCQYTDAAAACSLLGSMFCATALTNSSGTPVSSL